MRQLFLLVASVLILAASSSPANAADEIKIASTGPGVSTLPLEIAARKGFFRDEGLEVLAITMRTNIAVNALLSRSVDYATPSTSVIKAAAAGLPVKLIAVLLGRPDYFLTVKKDVRSFKDLKGKRIAIGSFGAAADLALRAVAKQEGLDADRELIRLQMGGAASHYASLIAGSVDATILTLPYNLQAEKPATRICSGSASAWSCRCRGSRRATKRFRKIPSRFSAWSERLRAR